MILIVREYTATNHIIYESYTKVAISLQNLELLRIICMISLRLSQRDISQLKYTQMCVCRRCK